MPRGKLGEHGLAVCFYLSHDISLRFTALAQARGLKLGSLAKEFVVSKMEEIGNDGKQATNSPGADSTDRGVGENNEGTNGNNTESKNGEENLEDWLRKL